MAATPEQIEALYQANLNRGSDPGGLSYYLNLAANGVTLSEIDTMQRGSTEYARVHAAVSEPPAPPPPPPPPVTTGGTTGTAPAPSPAPAPPAGTSGVTTPTDTATSGDADQWLPWTWATNRNVMIGGGLLLAFMLFAPRKR